MREICIKTVYKENADHVVKLGNGTVHKFRNEKAARKFLADTNRFLSEILFKCNQSLSELYTHGREVWIISDQIREHHGLNDRYRDLEHFLKQSYSRSTWASGSFFVFIDLKKYCEAAKALIKFLRNIRYVNQSDTLRRHRLESLFEIIHGIEMQLLNYGQMQAYEHFNVSRFYSEPDTMYNERSMLKIA